MALAVGKVRQDNKLPKPRTQSPTGQDDRAQQPWSMCLFLGMPLALMRSVVMGRPEHGHESSQESDYSENVDLTGVDF
jgi:hypothetical protein